MKRHSHPNHVRALLLRLLAACLPASEKSSETAMDLLPAPAWVRAALAENAIPACWHSAQEFSAPVVLGSEGACVPFEGFGVVPHSLLSAHTLPLYAHCFDPAYMPVLAAQYDDEERLALPSADSTEARALQVWC